MIRSSSIQLGSAGATSRSIMRFKIPQRMFSLLAIASSVFVCSQTGLAQNQCITRDDVKRFVAQINTQQNSEFNPKLRNDLLKLKSESESAFDQIVAKNRKDDALKKRVNKHKEKINLRLCQMLQKFGWPTASMVGQDGVGAAFDLIRTNATFELQMKLLPAIFTAGEKGEIKKQALAGLIDRLRLAAGLKQVFGTEAVIRNGFIVLLPIEAERDVNARRKQYDLPPLADDLLAIQRTYRLPLMKAPATIASRFRSTFKNSIENGAAASLLGVTTVGEDEVIRVDTNLVSVNVSVYNDKLKTYIGALAKDDFQIFEDGHEETITFFASTEVPFDLVLLIDLSGSTSGKRDLIRKTTERFIAAARPGDRLAIVTFADSPEILAPLTEDRATLRKSIENMNGNGNTNAWDALKFTLERVVGPKSLDRRRAIVMMSDGVDSALWFNGSQGSQISFADLLEAVRQNDTLIIPIYLDTEPHGLYEGGTARVYENARRTLSQLAEESGGLYYKARKIEDLTGVYEQVLNDLGKVYSLGYQPTNGKRDGAWRTLKMSIGKHPELVTRAKPGYYAK